jgi:integral membrane protein
MAILSHRGFRVLGVVEALSFLVLLLIAMPLKYFAHLPLAVTIFGTLHGVIFLAYVAVLAILTVRDKRPWWGLGGLVAGILPFGPFVFHKVARSKG